VASVLNLNNFIYDVFGDEGIDWNPDLTDRYSTELRDLLERCLSLDPNDRPDFPEVLKEIRKYRLTFQDGLRDKPAGSKDWESYLLIPGTTCINQVRVRRIRFKSLGYTDHFAGIRQRDGNQLLECRSS
jgi:serine/threonine protein kinase